MSTSKELPSPIFKKWYVQLMALAIVLGLALFLLLGLYGNDTKRLYYGYEAKTAFGDELRTLKDPLDKLGFKGVTEGSSKCSTYPVYGYDTSQLQCIAGNQNYVVIGSDEASKSLFKAKAKALDQLLANDKWTTTNNSAPNLTKWFEDISSGKDWYTDINSTKNSGDKHCSLAFNVAYSNPKPPAFVLKMSCSSPALDKHKDKVSF
jgi:hypothetical protein